MVEDLNISLCVQSLETFPQDYRMILKYSLITGRSFYSFTDITVWIMCGSCVDHEQMRICHQNPLMVNLNAPIREQKKQTEAMFP